MFLGMIVDAIVELIYKLLITIVSLIYKLVSLVYQIFLVLAETNLFEQDLYESLTDKVYIILAVVMLFVAAYTFITLIIDPDKNKGGKAIEDLIKKAITSLILIVLCPTLFTLAFDLQSAIMKQNIIGQFFTSEATDYDPTESVKTGGNLMAGTTWAAFFTPSMSDEVPEKIENQSEGKYINKGSGEHEEIDCTKEGKCTLGEANAFAQKTGEFGIYTAFSYNWVNSDSDGGVEFNFFLALIAGGYLIYVIVSFCFDLAIRVIKLAFYQIIAPICIACRILPDKESIFKNWWKAVSKTYLSVFIRVFIMNLGVFLLVQLNSSNFWGNICDEETMECGGAVEFIAKAFIVMGLLTFIKQAAKLIDEIFGLGDVKLGITDKLKEGGGFAGMAMARAGVRGVAAGAKNGWHGLNGKKWKDLSAKEKAKHLGGNLLRSTARGANVGASAMFRSLKASTNNFGSDKFMNEMHKTGENARIAAQQAEIGQERFTQTVRNIPNLFTDLKTVIRINKEKKDLERQISELQQQLREHLRDGDLDATVRLKAQLDAAEKAKKEQEKKKADYLDSVRMLQDQKQKEIDIAQKFLDDLRNSNASAAAIRDAEAKLQQKKDEKAAIVADADKIKKLDDSIAAADKTLQNASDTYTAAMNDYATKHNITVAEAERQREVELKLNEEFNKKINDQIASLKVEIEAKNKEGKNLELTSIIDNIGDSINKYCFQNKNGILQIMDERLDAVTKKVEKITSKYNHAITVDIGDALKKNATLSAYQDDIRKIFYQLDGDGKIIGGKSVQEIESLSRSLKTATSLEQVQQILGKDIVDKLNIGDDNYVKFQQAFIDTIDNPFHKDVTKATADAINGIANSNIVIDSSKRDAVLTDRDAEDARTEEFAYQVAYEAIYGKDGSTLSYKGKKDLQDRLRDESVTGQRHDVRQKVQNQIFTVTTDDKKKK